ncbi:porin [Chitinimonas sp. BJYL2]|uniref:porin n=1 Tax=Chitinimonas sp. BJYL2 TaxID=2976696 RepID=UPI0022B4A22B|nr:porin [Chitinimonas sp. BJYL2]
MKKQFAALALFAAIATPVMADGFYVGADAGRSKYSFDGGSENDTTLGIFAGYDVHPNFAIEAGYRTFGEISGSDEGVALAVEATGPQASLIAKTQIADGVDVYGRFGVMSVKLKATASMGGVSASESETKARTLFGLGARYAVTKEFGVRAEYTQVAKWDDLKLSTFTVGADYRF